MAVTFTNYTATPLGLWDASSVYHIVPPYGGNATLEPDELSQDVIGVYVGSLSGAITEASAPLNTIAPAVTGTETVGEELTVDNGTWTGSPAPTYTYQWQTSVDGTGSWIDLVGATAATYLLLVGQVGLFMRCVVRGTNALGNSAANSNVTIAISGV